MTKWINKWIRFSRPWVCRSWLLKVRIALDILLLFLPYMHTCIYTNIYTNIYIYIHTIHSIHYYLLDISTFCSCPDLSLLPLTLSVSICWFNVHLYIYFHIYRLIYILLIDFRYIDFVHILIMLIVFYVCRFFISTYFAFVFFIVAT